MNPCASSPFRVVILGLLLTVPVLFSGCKTTGGDAACSCCADCAAGQEPPGFLVRTNYKGWEDSILVSNGKIEAIIVPAIGRVMQLRFAGETDGPFWENAELNGRKPDAKSREWANFGGDKAWPSPQAEWSKVMGYGWPPPPAFDSMPCEVKIRDFEVTLISPVDPFFGTRVVRRIKLDLHRPEMDITTTFEKVSRPNRDMGVWVVSQLKHPQALFAPVSELSRFRGGFDRQTEETPPSLEIKDGLLSMTRDQKKSYKVGLDTGILFWVGEKEVLKIVSPRNPGGNYPDNGSSAEIYTSADPTAYIELELLGPLDSLHPGSKTTSTSTYTLLRRTEVDPELEVRKLLAN